MWGGFFMNKKFARVGMKNFLILLICFMTAIFGVVNPISIRTTPIYSCSVERFVSASEIPSIRDMIKSLFKKEGAKVDTAEKRYVYLGGYPLGFTISCKGVVVVAISNKSASGLKEGDIITKIEDIEVKSAEEIAVLINSEGFAGKPLKLTISRAGKEESSTIIPIYDTKTMVYKLGVWIRDDAAGVGTITYIRKDNLRFGALGHPVCDIDTGALLPIDDGNIFKCNIVGLKRGLRGNPGELKGLFLRNGSMLGNLDSNNKFGVYGKFSEEYLKRLNLEVVEVASRDEVKNGKAQIRSTVDGCEPKYYDIEIVKTYVQNSKDNKSMFIRVVDKELLSKTGGIVQGMSGSPIIQNGKLVGAVTHVFVSDPTKGYGVYADWMFDN